MQMTESSVREYVRLHNELAEARHKESEARAKQALAEMDWTPEQLAKYQALVARVGDRLAVVLSRKPKVFKNRRLPR